MARNKFIHENDFCMVTTNKFEEHGVKNGHRVFVVGHKAIPEDERDPYTQRIKFFVHLLKNKHVMFEEGVYIMDPKSLKKVTANEQKNLMEILKLDVATNEENTTN